MKIAFTLHSLFLLCGFAGLLTGVFSSRKSHAEVTSRGSGGCCPAGWTQLGSRCFIYHDAFFNFQDAERVCQLIGGNLASIHNAVEYFLVLDLAKDGILLPGDIWLGLHEAVEHYAFLWTDGSQFDFDAPFFDDNFNITGACIKINSDNRQWYREACFAKNRLVCSRDAPQCCH